MFRQFLAIAALVFSCILPAVAQQKKDLLPEDYGKWQNLSAVDIAENGDWVSYLISVQQDNDTLYVKNTKTNQSYKLEFASGAVFSKDNQWMAFRVGVSYKEGEKLREQNKPIEYKVGLLNLRTGKKQFFPLASRFLFSDNSKFLAIDLNPVKDSKEKGSVLLLRNLTDSSTHTIGNVTEYAFNKKGDYLAYIIGSANTAANSVELLTLSSYTLKVLASDTTRFSRLSWNENGEGLVFYQVFKDEKHEEENAMVYAYSPVYEKPLLRKFNPLTAKNFPVGMRVFPESSLSMADDQHAVFFGIREWTAKPEKESKKTDSTVKSTDSAKRVARKPEKKEEKLAAVDVWHWKDPDIQPRQKLSYNQDKNRNFLSVWNLEQESFVQLSRETTDRASLNPNQVIAVLSDGHLYKPAFKEDYADITLLNARTGEELFTLKGFMGVGPYTSPEGKFLTFYREKNWWSYEVSKKVLRNLTQNSKAKFWNTRDDHPAAKPPFGFAGWTKGDRELFFYDEYNVWAFKPDGSGSRKLTDGEKDQIVHRIYNIDFENPWIDDSKPVFISTYGDKTKQSGYLRYDDGKLTKLIYENKSIGRLDKAKQADVFTYVSQDFDQSPALHLTSDFQHKTLVTETNPQQANYYWGKSELVNFTNKAGKKMQGALFYPANYQPGKKYPMIVYIYEILSNTVHGYTIPNERSAYNTSNFTTQGYFVFRPDIVYEINDPGRSAVNCVVPAVEAVLKTGMIDKDKVGLMGHSWGAYQTSFIITQTNLFSAAIAGAPLTDMISMSMSIYWNSGIPDQKIFETSQGRFDGPWYERMNEHMRNSPMFEARKINTPLLVAFGDKDGAVDWHQGIEMYGTLRRMQKPHVMLVYAEENHGLAKKENQIDYQRRQREWFDHYLLGKPAAKWITEGIKYTEKMKEREKPAAAR